MSSATRPVPRFRVGDWVSFLYGSARAVAQVIEDRGPIGVGGRRLYRIRLELDPAEPSLFELPEDVLAPADAPAEANPLLKATLEYLSQGKRFERISPEKVGRSRQRRVTFTFADGTEDVRSFKGDHATFMRWWKETSAYLRRMADAFGNASEV